MTNVPTNIAELPDWWEREKRRRQMRVLLFLGLLLTLIGFFYWKSAYGRVGKVAGVNFDAGNYIAFVHQDDKGTISLKAVRVDGSDLRSLTQESDKSNKSDPSWMADAKGLVYASNKNDVQTTQIYLVGEGEPRQLTYGTGNKFTPVVSADRKSIAFITQGAVKTVLLNGVDVRQIMPPPQSGSNNADGAPPETLGEFKGPYIKAEFSPDGRGIAGVQTLSAEMNVPELAGGVKLGEQLVRVIHPDGDKALALETGKEVSFAWAPDGKSVACSYTDLEVAPPGQKAQTLSGIRIWDFETPEKPKVQKIVLTAQANTIHPKNISWSPDGRYIAFECWLIKSPEERVLAGIAVADVNRPGLIQTAKDAQAVPFLVPASAEGKPMNPKWSPDGTRLLYELQRPKGGQDLYVVNTDGSNAINLTKGAGFNSQAVWAPVVRR